MVKEAFYEGVKHAVEGFDPSKLTIYADDIALLAMKLYKAHEKAEEQEKIAGERLKALKYFGGRASSPLKPVKDIPIDAITAFLKYGPKGFEAITETELLTNSKLRKLVEGFVRLNL